MRNARQDHRRRGAAALAALGAALGAPAAGCSNRDRGAARALPSADPRQTAATGSVATDGETDPLLALEGAPAAPRPLSGPLLQCIRRVQRATPPELAAALESIEYPAVAEDACRMDLAVATRDPALCDGVALSMVRENCRTRTAVALAQPERCPDARLDLGHDPVCIALAARSAALCAAAPPADVVRCLAVARRAPEQCDALSPPLRPRCRADVVALRAALGSLGGAPLPRGVAHLRLFALTGARGAADGAGRRVVRETDLDIAARGAWLDPSGALWLVDPTRGWPSEFAPALHGGAPVVGAAVALPLAPGPGGRVVDLRVVMPDGLVIQSLPGAPGEVQLEAVTRTRGGTVAGSLTVPAAATGVSFVVELTFRTFVRDIAAPEVLRRP